MTRLDLLKRAANRRSEAAQTVYRADRNMEEEEEEEEKMESSKVKVLGFWASAFSHRARWALELKGVHYEYIEEDITQEKSHLLLEANPVHKKVPILFHQGRTVAESTVIMEYIEETWPETPLMPADPYQKALARFWIKFGEEKVTPIICSYLITIGEEHEKATNDVREMLRFLDENCLGNKKFFGGDEIGLVDLAFGWLAYYLEPIEEATTGGGGGKKLMDGDVLPRLCAWVEAFKGVPVIKRHIPDYDKLLSHLVRVRGKLISSSA